MANTSHNAAAGLAATSHAVKEPGAKLCYTLEPIEFETVGRLIMFLESLFQLKPNLLTSYSLDKLRIVIEISQ